MQTSLGVRTSAVVLTSLLACPSIATAQPQYEVLHAFQGITGESRAPLLEASDGTLYGVTTKGGRGGGVIFALRPETGGFRFETVHEFEKHEGGEPLGALIEVDGELYGTTSSRGAAGLGTVFKVDVAGQFVLLHTFTGGDGAKPVAALVRGRDGALYGTTNEGGAGGFGTVFRMTTNGALTTLHSFGEAGGRHPLAGLTQGADGYLYGTTGSGGSGLGGTMFRIASDLTLTTVYSFSVSDLIAPGQLVQGTDGDLYGQASRGIISGATVFFRITTGGVFTPLYTTTTTEGYGHTGMIRGSDGNFYGTLTYGGSDADHGTAFKLTPFGGLTVLHSFTRGEGSNAASLIQARDGFFYGVTATGGIGKHGLVYRMTPSGLLLHLYHFTSSDGEGPWSPPVRGSDGALYGTTVRGGTFNRGTIYRVAPDGALRTIYSFTGLEGASPFGGLLLGTDGFLYGTTAEECDGGGSIFRLATPGMLEVLHCFQPGEGSQPFATLMQASDGNLYGTTRIGGAYDQGTVFKITPEGGFTQILSLAFVFIPFGGAFGAAFPFGSLTEGPDGELIGTAANAAGSLWAGTVFSVLQDGSFTVLHRFLGTFSPTFPPSVNPGPRIFGGLTRTHDGFLYGANEFGQLFRFNFSPDGAFFELVGYLDGQASLPPIESRDGNLYGATGTSNEPDGTGSIYRVSPSGEITTLKVLTEEEGAFPFGVIEAEEGRLYGSAYSGGPAGRGVIYRFRVK